MKFSIIVPVYNVEKYLAQCIDSILMQTFTDYEIILVDDGSADNGGKMCDAYAAKNKNIKVIHKNNGGLSSARNAGVEIAQGEYILFVDGDDYYDDKNVFSDLNKLTDGVDVICFGLKKLYEATGKIQTPVQKDSTLLASACCKGIRSELFKQFDLSFEKNKFSEDIEWAARLICVAKSWTDYHKSPYVYRQREQSISQSLTEKNITDFLGHIKKILHLIDAEKNKAVLKKLKTYIAFQYFTLMATQYFARESEGFVNLFAEIKLYRYLLKYGIDRQVKIIKWCVRLLGYKNTCKLMWRKLYD